MASQNRDRRRLPGNPPLSVGRDGSRVGRRSITLALPFGSTPLDSEEGREFLQQRLALFAKVTFVLGGLSFVATQLIQLGIRGMDFATRFDQHGSIFHVAGTLIALLMWLLARRIQTNILGLIVLDVAGTLLSLMAYALMALASAPLVADRVPQVMMLVTLCMLTLRAVIVPSTLRHTLLVSGVGSVPVLALSYYTGTMYPSAAAHLPPVVTTGYIAVWAALGLAISGVASQVIYGLRAQVAQAQRLGQYVLDEKIGEGGMGVVYRARHALLRRPTAIKLVLPDRAPAQLLLRFEREVQLTAKLNHPNTVSIYDYGRTPEGVFYYAMEYLDGIDLEELVRRFGPQSPSRVASILQQVGGSLAEAHSVGLVHRDIKPANIILCDRGALPETAKVVDFGLVKDVSNLGRGKPTLSSVNAIIGTPLYLAPESILTPDTVDGRADLYALGAVGYYLLTGQPVFTGSSVVEVCAQHIHAPPLPPSLRLGSPVPEALEALILHCLKKDPADRPRSALDALSALETSGVPPWSRDDSAAWWRVHGPAAKVRTRSPAPDNAGELDTVLVDLSGRQRQRASRGDSVRR